jgi:hypothetical protein
MKSPGPANPLSTPIQTSEFEMRDHADRLHLPHNGGEVF